MAATTLTTSSYSATGAPQSTSAFAVTTANVLWSAACTKLINGENVLVRLEHQGVDSNWYTLDSVCLRNGDKTGLRNCEAAAAIGNVRITYFVLGQMGSGTPSATIIAQALNQ